MRKFLFAAILAACAATASITAAVADPLWSWGDDEWNHDSWSYHDWAYGPWSYRDWAYGPSGYSGWGYYYGWENGGWPSGWVIAPYASYPVARYHHVDYGYTPYVGYPIYGYHFGFWGACGC